MTNTSKKAQKQGGQDFTTTITVDGTPSAAWKAINAVAKWWTKSVDGATTKLGDEFTVRFGEVHYSKQRLVEVVRDERVVWLVTDSKLSFTKDPSEWTGTRVCFSVAAAGKKTKIVFSHQGLVPGVECYGGCAGAWTQFIETSLAGLIETGRGLPDVLP